MLYTVLLLIRAPFYLLLAFVCMCSVFKVVLVKSSLLAKRLARKTPLRKPNRSEGIISMKPRPKSVWLSWFIVFFLCLLAWYCAPALHDILLTSMARCSLIVLKVPLNTKQANKRGVQQGFSGSAHLYTWWLLDTLSMAMILVRKIRGHGYTARKLWSAVYYKLGVELLIRFATPLFTANTKGHRVEKPVSIC